MKKKVLSVLSVFAMTVVVAMANPKTNVKVSVDPQEKFQTIEFFGAADAWSGNFVGKYWADNSKSKIADYLFSRIYNEAFSGGYYGTNDTISIV